MTVNPTYGYIFGRDVRSGEFVTVQRNGRHTNMMANGGPGTGKSRCFLSNIFVQSMLAGENILIVDFQNELLHDCMHEVDRLGYRVRTIKNARQDTAEELWKHLSSEKAIVNIAYRVPEESAALIGPLLDGIVDHGCGGKILNILLDEASYYGRISSLPALLSHELLDVNVYIVTQSMKTFDEIYGVEQTEQIRAAQDAFFFYGAAHNIFARSDYARLFAIPLGGRAGGGMCANMLERKALVDISMVGRGQAVMKAGADKETVLFYTLRYDSFLKLTR